MSLFEASTGLGFLFGPLIGAGLYSIGGYILPFYGLSMVYILLLPLIVYIARLVEKAEVTQSNQAAEIIATLSQNNIAINEPTSDT